MVGKYKYAFIHNGKQYTRTSDRKYTHAVVAVGSSGNIEVSYATTSELADKRARAFSGIKESIKDPITKRYKNIGKPIYSGVKIIKL
jgi:hypothetical protein